MEKERLPILRKITWPKPLQAIKLTAYCGIASIIIASVIYFYDFGISKIVDLFY